MDQFIPMIMVPMIIVVPLLVFWLWMFRDMTNNYYLSRSSKYYWTLAFAFMSVFGAFSYYYLVYRNKY